MKKLRIPYCLAIYGKPEIDAVVKVLKNPLRISPGALVREFERKIARIFGKKHGVMVNSGSSANLIAFEALDLPKGSEVITPALTFATTVAPIIQKGLVPVYVDVEPGTYVVDVSKIEPLITKKTKALMIPSLIGNIPELKKIQRIAKKHKLYFIEDSCDTLGASYVGKPTGHYSDITTTSFYASHIITTAGAGGMACFHDPKLARNALIKTSWGRDSTLFGVHEKSEDLTKRFQGMLDGRMYDAKFIFSEVGYNFQSTEMNAAFGLEQLKRLEDFGKKRKHNFALLTKFFKQYEHFFILPREHKGVKTNWMVFPLTIKKGAPFTRNEITKYLEKNNIQTRPVFAGNITRQPAYKSKGNYPVSDYIMWNAFLIGCHQGLTDKHLSYVKQTFTNFLSKYDTQ